MLTSKLPRWLMDLRVMGSEPGDEDDPYERDAQGEIVEEDGEKKLKEGWEYDDDGEPVESEEEEAPDDGKDDDDLTKEKKKSAALEEALNKERREKRKLEREAKKAKRTAANKKDQKEEEDAARKLEQSEAKTARLAKGLLNSQRDAAILEAARKLNFIDPSDALTDDIRDEVDFDQDEEDPSDIDIDLDSVKDAVKDLAARKKHLVGKPGPTEKSGSKFGGGKRGDKNDSADEQALKGNYPSLR